MYLTSTESRPIVGASIDTTTVMSPAALSSEIKRAGRQVHHPTPPSTEKKINETLRVLHSPVRRHEVANK